MTNLNTLIIISKEVRKELLVLKAKLDHRSLNQTVMWLIDVYKKQIGYPTKEDLLGVTKAELISEFEEY